MQVRTYVWSPIHAYIGVSYVYIPIAHYVYAYAYSLLSLPILSLVCFAEL